jgi:two-component system, CitB family, response regulator
MISVMIIEDDPMVREINSKFLNRIEGFKLCSAAGTLSDAVNYAVNTHPDLILLDIYLPQENGLDFLKWLRKEEIGCDVILITADKSMESVQEALRYGAIDYLIKPFTFERFKDALTKYRDLKNSFESADIIEQKILDCHIFNKKNEEPLHDELAKGLNWQTYNSIRSTVKEWKASTFSAEEIAEMLGMARVTVRRYLDSMLKEGKLDIEIEYGRVGRPQHKYKITKR